MSTTKRYIVTYSEEENESCSDDINGTWFKFKALWNNIFGFQNEKIEISIEGDDSDPFFYSLNDARDFCESHARDLQAEDSIDIGFEIYEANEIDTDETIRKAIKERKHSQFLVHAESILIKSLTEDDLTDLEKEVLENCPGSSNTACARKTATWILENLNMISKHKKENINE